MYFLTVHDGMLMIIVVLTVELLCNECKGKNWCRTLSDSLFQDTH